MESQRTIPVVKSLPAPGNYLCGLTFDGDRLWYSDQDAEKIYAVDPTTGAVVRELDCAKVRADLAFHDGQLCQVGGRPKRVVVVDPASGDIVEEKRVLPSNGRLCGIEMGPDGMWMCLRGPTVLQLRDFETMTVQRELPVEGASPSGLTYVDGTVLYGEFDEGVVRAVDTETGELLATVAVEGHPTGMTWDGEYVWYCDFSARSFKAMHLGDLRPAPRAA
jgi:outer membrane protein assembly factor BamB